MKEKYTNRKKDHIDNSSDENDSHECLAYFFYTIRYSRLTHFFAQHPNFGS